MSISQVLLDINDPTLRRVAERWLSWRMASGLPVRRQIDPTELGPTLPFVWICERDAETASYRYRLVGEAVNVLYGRNLRGLRPTDFLSACTAERIEARLDDCLSSTSITHTVTPQTLHDNHHVLVQRLLLPLEGDRGIPDTILGCTKATASLREAEPPRFSPHEATYNCRGERLRTGHPAVTMFPGPIFADGPEY